ncbi:hypothetical protein AYI70_g1676 [Smittium culicis]|uniref:Myb/SANT-like DNA-binding domain-containing protein n=1 Tax=Smittium culicis TaxID=133412 RepID=A0A1R1YBQ9_9FUNG|nr:hypothetical protein AYI70_g1676 [Smittium culicis]
MSDNEGDFIVESNQFNYNPMNGIQYKDNQLDEDLQKDNISLEVEQVLVSYPNNYSVSDSISQNLANSYTNQNLSHASLADHSDSSKNQVNSIDSESEKKEIIQTFHNAVETLNKEQGHNIVIGYNHPPPRNISIDQDFHRLGLGQMNQERLLSPKFNRSKNWSKEETALMLSGLVELTKNLPPKKRELMLRNNVIFDQIAADLQSKGYDRNNQACLVRWRNILRIYKTQRRIAMENGTEIKDNQYSAEIEQIYSNSPEELCFDYNEHTSVNSPQDDNNDDTDQSNTNTPSSAPKKLNSSVPSTPSNLNGKKIINSSSKSKSQRLYKKSIRPCIVPKTPAIFSQGQQYDQNFQATLLLPKSTAGYIDQQGIRHIASNTPIAPNSASGLQNAKGANRFTPLLMSGSQNNPSLASGVEFSNGLLNSDSNYESANGSDQSTLLEASNNPNSANNKWNQSNPSSNLSANQAVGYVNNQQNASTTPIKSDILYQYSVNLNSSSKKRKKNQQLQLEADVISKFDNQIIKIFQLLAEQSEHYQRLSAEVQSIKDSVTGHQDEISKLCKDIEAKDQKRDELQLQVMNTVQALSNVIAEKKD